MADSGAEQQRVPGLSRFIDANEPRLIAFNEYVNEDHSEVTVVQVHPDAASLEFHMGIIGTSHAGGWSKRSGHGLCPGARHDAVTGGWQRLAGALTRRRNRVQAVDLPTGQPELLAADYAGLAAGQVADTMDHPVVVAHSGSCLLLPAIAREVGARRLVWLAGYIPGPAGGPSFAGEIKAAGSEMFSGCTGTWPDPAQRWMRRRRLPGPAQSPPAAPAGQER
jgi:hypothetical protein